jgi:hypothetical protein
MDWIEDESIRLFCPCLADVFVGCQALEGLEPASKVVGRDEVGEVAAQLVVGFVIVALDRRLFEGARHVADQLRPRWPKLAMLMDDSEHDVLAYMIFPGQHRTKLHSTDEIDKPFERDLLCSGGTGDRAAKSRDRG